MILRKNDFLLDVTTDICAFLSFLFIDFISIALTKKSPILSVLKIK